MKNHLLKLILILISGISNAQNSTTFINKANEFLFLGNYSAAINEYDKIIKLSPNNADILYKRAIAKERMGLLNESVVDYTKSIEIKATVNSYLQRGKVYEQLGKDTQAIDDFTNGIQLNNKIADLYFYRGVSKFKLQDSVGSCEDWLESSKLSKMNRYPKFHNCSPNDFIKGIKINQTKTISNEPIIKASKNEVIPSRATEISNYLKRVREKKDSVLKSKIEIKEKIVISKGEKFEPLDNEKSIDKDTIISKFSYKGKNSNQTIPKANTEEIIQEIPKKINENKIDIDVEKPIIPQINTENPIPIEVEEVEAPNENQIIEEKAVEIPKNTTLEEKQIFKKNKAVKEEFEERNKKSKSSSAIKDTYKKGSYKIKK